MGAEDLKKYAGGVASDGYSSLWGAEKEIHKMYQASCVGFLLVSSLSSMVTSCRL